MRSMLCLIAPHSIQHRVDSLTRASDSVLVVYDTVKRTFTKTLARYDTMRVTDTVVRFDSVTRETVVYVNRDVADTAIKACTLVARTCESGWRLEHTARLTLDSLLANQKSQTREAIRAGRVSMLRVGAIGVGVGIVAGMLFRR